MQSAYLQIFKNPMNSDNRIKDCFLNFTLKDIGIWTYSFLIICDEIFSVTEGGKKLVHQNLSWGSANPPDMVAKSRTQLSDWTEWLMVKHVIFQTTEQHSQSHLLFS